MAINEQWVYAQQSILGSVLICPELAGKLVFGVESSDFTPPNRAIYNAIRDLYTSGKTVDPVTVLHQVGGEYRDLVVGLMEITPTAAHIDSYVEVCRNCSRIHKYREMGAALQIVETMEQAEEILASVNQVRIGRGMSSWSLKEAFHDFFRRYGKKKAYIPWFIPQLGSQLTLERGDLCLVGGRPSAGKSAFAIEAAVYWAAVCGYRVGFYSHETSREKLTDRMVAACARVPLDGIKNNTLTDKQLQDVCTVTAKINEAPIDLIACSGKSVAEMQANALANRHEIIVVDYLQIVAASGQDEYAQVSSISKSLHVMCQSLGIFCLALCQLSRTRGAKPTLEDLRSSGQLEQDADAVIFLHKKDAVPNERELVIAKNKEGECRTTRLHFNGPIQHFSYLGKGDQPLVGHDYLTKPGYRAPAEGDADQLEMLPADTDVPFKD